MGIRQCLNMKQVPQDPLPLLTMGGKPSQMHCNMLFHSQIQGEGKHKAKSTSADINRLSTQYGANSSMLSCKRDILVCML